MINLINIRESKSIHSSIFLLKNSVFKFNFCINTFILRIRFKALYKYIKQNKQYFIKGWKI